MRKFCVVHFQEIEKYPPTINLLRYLHEYSSDNLIVEVLTTRGDSTNFATSPGIKIHRLAKWKRRTNKVSRILLYLRFNFLAIIKLIRFSPDAILYYETLSAGPPWFYKKFIRKDVEVYVHYHEYVSKREYEDGMKLSKWLYEREKELLPLTVWVSHTNADRMALFLKDVPSHQPPFTYIAPNYPPANWREKTRERKEGKVGFVYVGAMSMKTMYIKEMAAFVAANPAKCYWDIYAANQSDEVLEFLLSHAGGNITFKGPVAYDELPEILSKYDVGLVLYKGHIPNYVYNVPNKLFEYHVCGLDVWFPDVMKSSLAMVTRGTYPRIVALNFEQLGTLNLEQLTDHSSLVKKEFDFYCEGILEPFAEKLTKRNAV